MGSQLIPGGDRSIHLRVELNYNDTLAVFDLPPGYTANAPSIGLANNMFVSGPVASEESTWGQVKALYKTSDR